MDSYRLERGPDGRPRVRVPLRGDALLRHPMYNKGTAFTTEERRTFGLDGLLPHEPNTIAQQVERIVANIARKPDPLEQYIGLTSLQGRNETLFYRVLHDHMERMLPIIYTPTVGKACQLYSRIFRHARGMWITPAHRGRIAEVLRNARYDDARLIVCTDNERILGLGDQGAGGMGIPIGKLAIYTVAAGIHPSQTLPISLDVGTDDAALREDPLYLGWRQKRLRGPEYEALVDELVAAVRAVFPEAVFQWEDFKKANAFHLLDRHRKALPSFNDDIQGTAAVTVATVFAWCRAVEAPLARQRIVILGAGAAGIGIAQQLRVALEREGLAGDALTRAIVLLDSRGLLLADGSVDEAHKEPFAWPAELARAEGLDLARRKDLLHVVEALRPGVLIGTTGHAGVFSEPVVRALAAGCARPLVLPLSNPTDLAEATPRDVMAWTDGRAHVATGSPFDPVPVGGRAVRISQANNAYVFPGVGLGAIVARAREVTDGMFTVAARTLAEEVHADDLAEGALLPPLRALRQVSTAIGAAVVREAQRAGVGGEHLADDAIEQAVRDAMWFPDYAELIAV